VENIVLPICTVAVFHFHPLLKWRRAEEEVEVLSHKQLVGASTPGSAVGLLVGARDLDAAGGRGDLSGAENAAVVAPLFPPPAEYEHTVEKDK
jgi:hypothetical protein